MIEKIPSLPDNVLGFSAKETVTANDYESVIIPAVEGLFSHQNKVRFLYHLAEATQWISESLVRCFRDKISRLCNEQVQALSYPLSDS